MTSQGDQTHFRFAAVTSALLFLLTILGYVFPGGLLWGISFTAFLPPSVLAGVAGCILLTIIVFSRRRDQTFLTGVYAYLDSRPMFLLAVSLLLFVALAVILRVRASVLGDSYTLIYNFLDYQNGVSILAPWHEPLSIYVLYYLVHWLGPLQFPEIYTSFAIVEILFGCAFIIVAWRTVTELFTRPEERIPTFVLLLSLPYMEFFMGYIEIYSVSTLLLGLYILFSIRVLQRKSSFALLPVLYLLMTMSHYINGLFCFALLYSLWLEYRERRFRSILLGAAIAAVAGLAMLFMARFDMRHLIDISPISHFLSFTGNITPINAYSQAYTIISFYHAVDIANYLVFVSPFAVAYFIYIGLNGRGRVSLSDHTALWLIAAAVPLVLFMGVAKLEQGFGSDWDVFAAHFYLLNLLFACLFHRRAQGRGQTAFLMVVLVSLLFSAPWFLLNATRDPSIRRFQSLWDQRILSHLGHYTHTQRLTRFYAAEGEPGKNIAVWEHYRHLFPGDPRGYENQIAVQIAYEPDSLAARDSVYAAWLAVDGENRKLRQEYSGFCVTEGNSALARGDTAAALLCYRKAVGIDPGQSRACNNYGSVLAQAGDIGGAIPWFERAIAADSLYGEAIYNLGVALSSIGERGRSLPLINRAAGLGNSAAKEYLNSLRNSGR
ncbi:MAG TPA: tetratricopeptide repeat protein [Bacteroidota bacterium]|nr:tetratricopeptide repeat protein [Bacteroidota bacterium]